jgi:phenyl-phosphate phosphatase/carboxylase subunit beta
MAEAGRKQDLYVGYKDLREYLQLLEEKGLLHRIKAAVDLRFEIGAIAARSLEQKGPALLFENIEGYEGMPLVANVISTTKQLAVAFNTEADEGLIHQRVVRGMDARIPSIVRNTGPCKDVIIKAADVDIDMVPTPCWHEHDGGRYLGTTSGFVTRDPLTGDLNMGSYRVMIKDKQTLSMAGGLRGRQSTTGAGGGDHILDNEKNKIATPVAIVMGMDPLLTLASGSPVAPGKDHSMEYEAAGGWRGAATELVKCETNDLLVPAHAEMIIEGEVIPHARTEEGPHGESTGFYGENKEAFVIKITCITHRKNPLSYGLICQRVEDYPRQLLRSGSIQSRVIQKTGLTNIKEVFFPEVGRMGMLIVSAKIRDKDDPKRIMDGIWNNTGERWRWIIVVDEDCNVRDWDEVMWRVVSTAEPEKHVVLGKVHDREKRKTNEVDFDPPSRGMGIDATFAFKDAAFPPVNKVSAALMEKVAARWKEYGLA